MAHTNDYDANALRNIENKDTPATPLYRYKYGWYETHRKQSKLINLNRSGIIIGDSIAAGLMRYKNIWKKYFYSTVNLGVGGDRVENVFWRAKRLFLPKSMKYAVIQCGSNNLDDNSPLDIANGTISIALTVKQKFPGVVIVITKCQD